MPPLSRLWLALPPEDGAPVGALLRELARRPLAALAHAADAPSRCLAELLVAHGAPRPILLPAPQTSDLDRLAAEHPDLEIAVLGDARLLLAAAALALGLARPDPASIRPRPGSLNAFHWPTGRDPTSRPELIGLDLDWFPPWHAGQARPRFPGGPGVAGGARG